jgi:hypothetical protein
MSGHKPQMGLDTKTYWLTERQSQCDFDFDLGWELRIRTMRFQSYGEFRERISIEELGRVLEGRNSKMIEQEIAERLHSDLIAPVLKSVGRKRMVKTM